MSMALRIQKGLCYTVQPGWGFFQDSYLVLGSSDRVAKPEPKPKAVPAEGMVEIKGCSLVKPKLEPAEGRMIPTHEP